MDLKLGKMERILLGSFGAAAVLILIGMVSGSGEILGNLVLVAVVVVVVPFFLYKYTLFRWIKKVEDQFPNFVRDLADSRRSGMSFSSQ